MATIDMRGATLSAADPPIGTNPNPDLAIKAPVRVATTGANIVLSGLQTIDGVALAAGDRVLVKDQADQTTNGIYNAASGPWTRTIDAANNSQWSQGLQVVVTQGAVNATSSWSVTTANPIILGTSLIVFTANPALGTMPAKTVKGNALSATGPAVNLTGDQVEQLLLFTQAGTAAVQRLLDAKIKEAVSVKDFGAKGDGSTNDSAAVQAAITAVSNAGGGRVYIPPGNYSLINGITIPDNVLVEGAGQNATILQAWHTDVAVVTLTGNRSALEKVSIYGKGVNVDTGTFGATQNALVVSAVEGIVRDVLACGGSAALFVPGVDCWFENLNTQSSYGPGNFVTNGANWYVRCKFDHVTTNVTPTTAQPYPNWAGTTTYTVGQVRINSGYALICSSGGTSGGSPPTNKNYGVSIVDGTVTWLLMAPASYAAVLLGSGCGENHFFQCDMSGVGYTNSIVSDTLAGVIGPSVQSFRDCVLASSASLSDHGNWFTLFGCELGGNIAVNPSFTGHVNISDCDSLGQSLQIAFGAGVSNFKVQGNHLGGGSIVVAAGASDNYIIKDNVVGSISDGGTGTNARVVDNVGYNTDLPTSTTFVARGVNFAVAGDTAIPIVPPHGAVGYLPASTRICNASATLVAGNFGVFTAPAGGGTAIIAAATAISVSSASPGVNNNAQLTSAANPNTQAFTPSLTPILYFRVGTTAAGTADVQISITWLY